MKKTQPLTAAEKMRAKRSRDKALHQKLGGKEKRIHLYDFSMKHIDQIMEHGKYSNEDEAIIDALAVASMLTKTDIEHFFQLLKKARQEKNE